MQLHASCAARSGDGVLLIGPSGAGKSDLLLRLLDHGFDLVADDQVLLEDGMVRAAPPLAGLIEVRGLGIVRMTHVAEARLALCVELGRGERLPMPERRHGVPIVHVDAGQASAPARVALALRCAIGAAEPVTGAFDCTAA